MKAKTLLHASLLPGITLFVTTFTSIAIAATSTFTGASNSNWSDAGNWDSLPTDGDNIAITDDAAIKTLILDDGSHTVGSITFGTSGARTGGFTITNASPYSDALTITGGVIAEGNFTTAGLGTNTFTFRVPLIIAQTQTWTVGGNDGFATGGTSNNDLGIAIGRSDKGAGNANTLTLNGDLAKEGTGMIVIAGTTVTGTGNLIINQGTIKLNAGESTPLTLEGGEGQGNITVNSGTALLVFKNSGALNLSRDIVLNDGGTLRVAGVNSITGGFGSNVTVNGNATFDASVTTTFDGSISGSGTLTKSGGSTLTFNGISDFSGTLGISAGTLTLGVDDALTSATVNLRVASGFNIGATTQTFHALTVASGVAAKVSGTGTLKLGAADFNILPSAINVTTSLDLSTLANFEYSGAGNAFGVAQGATYYGSTNTLKLAQNNTITAKTVTVGSSSFGDNGIMTVNLQLGQSNVIETTAIFIGMTKTTGNMLFQSGLNSPTLTIRGIDGGAAPTLTIGSLSGGYQQARGTLDLVTGINGSSVLDATFSTVTIGIAPGGSRYASGTLKMGDGILRADNILLGSSASSGQTTTGTLEIYGGTVQTKTLTMAAVTNSGNATGVLTLDSGGTLAAQNIVTGTKTGSGTATRTLNWNDGTIRNYNTTTDLGIGEGINIKLAASGTHTFEIDSGRAGTVASAISDATSSGTLTKTGTGLLTLAAANTYTGSTIIKDGILALASTGTLAGTGKIVVGDGTVAGANAVFDVSAYGTTGYTIASGQALGGVGTVIGTITVAGTISPGNSVGTITFSDVVTVTETGIIVIEISGANTYDTINAQAGMSFAQGATIELNFVEGYQAATGDIYNLFYGSGSIAGMDGVSVTSNLGSDYAFILNSSGGVSVTVIPEPSTYALIGGIAVAGFALTIRRRRG